MEIIASASEEYLAEFLPEVEKDAASWTGVHVNLAKLHEQLLGSEVLSPQLLEKVRQVGLQMAEHLQKWGVKDCEGKLYVFSDSDVLCLIKRQAGVTEPILERIRQEFDKNKLRQLLHIHDMRVRLAAIVELSTKKRAVAAEHHQAIRIADRLIERGEHDTEITLSLQKKRASREGKGCILIIDDDILTRSMLVTLLKQHYYPLQARDAREGLIQYIEQAPDMVFMEIHLPTMEGKDLLKRIRMLDPQAYVVMLSANSVLCNIRETRRQGAAGFICKPFSKGKVLEYVNKCPLNTGERVPHALGWRKAKAS